MHTHTHTHTSKARPRHLNYAVLSVTKLTQSRGNVNSNNGRRTVKFETPQRLKRATLTATT